MFTVYKHCRCYCFLICLFNFDCLLLVYMCVCVCVCVCVYTRVCVCCALSFSHVGFFAIAWAVVHQAPLSMGFIRQLYWCGSHSFLWGFSPLRDWTWVFCIAGGFFNVWTPHSQKMFAGAYKDHGIQRETSGSKFILSVKIQFMQL